MDILELHSRSAPSLLTDLIQMVDTGLSHSTGEKTLPTILLYDEHGLRLYDIITTDAPEYYLFRAEEQILEDHADEIVKIMHGAAVNAVPGERVLELGAGYASFPDTIIPVLTYTHRALRKTSHILSALARSVTHDTSVTYYALDLEKRELERALIHIHKYIGKALQGRVIVKGIFGTYNDGLKYIAEGNANHVSVATGPMISSQFIDDMESPVSLANSSASESRVSLTDTPSSSPGASPSPIHIMFLGSSLGNFSRSEAVEFLRCLPLRSGSGDTLLIGLDHDNDPTQIETAYNDASGHTENFIKNGLRAAGRVLGNENLFDKDNWEYVNKYDSVSPHRSYV